MDLLAGEQDFEALPLLTGLDELGVDGGLGDGGGGGDHPLDLLDDGGVHRLHHREVVGHRPHQLCQVVQVPGLPLTRDKRGNLHD